MLQFEELRLKLQGMEPELRELKQSLNIDKLGIEIAELERKAAEPSFWDDMENRCSSAPLSLKPAWKPTISCRPCTRTP